MASPETTAALPSPTVPPSSFVLGPLIVSSSLAWALWGLLTLHLLLFVRDVKRRRSRAERDAAGTTIERTFPWLGRGKGTRPPAQREEEVNPWTMSFAAPSISAYPTSARPQTHQSQRRHAHHRSSKSMHSSSLDPYSPTAAGEQDSKSVLLPSHHEESFCVTSFLISKLAIILVIVVYILVVVRSALGTTHLWHISTGGLDPNHKRWIGIQVGNIIGPIVFILVAVYYIYALYVVPLPSATQSRQPPLRPLSLPGQRSLAKSKEAEFPSPTSTAPSAFPPHPIRTRSGSSSGLKLKFGSLLPTSVTGVGDTPGSRRVDSAGNDFLSRRRVESLCAITAAVVIGACGIVDGARSGPLGEVSPIDAPSLIWYAGMLVFDAVLCFLLSRQLLFEGGGAQFILSIVAFILVIVWRDDKPLSSLPFVIPAILPAVYANSALAHASRVGRMSYWFSAGYTGSDVLSHDDRELGLPERRTSSRNSMIPKFESMDNDIEMGVRSTLAPAGGGVELVSRAPNAHAARERHVDLAAATALSSTSNTFSTTGSGSRHGEDMVRDAMAMGAEREREKERRQAEAKLTGMMPMVLDRDTNGSGSRSGVKPTGSTTNLVPSTTAPRSLNKSKRRASLKSGVSGASAVTSLELPVFRKGKRRFHGNNAYGYGQGDYEWDESDWESGSDELTFLTSDDEDGGKAAWDYGFSNLEKEKEREERAATMLTAAAASSVIGGSRTQNVSGLNFKAKRNSCPTRQSPSRRSSWRRTVQPHPLATSASADADDEDYDTLSVLSGTSRRSKRYSRRSYYPPTHPHAKHPLPVRRLLPTPPTHSPILDGPQPPIPSASSESLPAPSFAAGSPQGSVLVISRAAEPSIAEPSIYHAASVAATRASTGSAFSTFSYTYPRPVHLPDLDMDLLGGGGGGEETLGLTSEVGTSGFGTATGMSGGLAGTLSPISPGERGTGVRSPHPYATGGSEMDLPPAEQTRRRWNVHPLKRFAEMGRLRR